MRLEGKGALITGSSSGFARASAYLFAKGGAKIVVSDVNDEGGREVVKRIKESGGEATYVHADVGIVSENNRPGRN